MSQNVSSSSASTVVACVTPTTAVKQTLKRKRYVEHEHAELPHLSWEVLQLLGSYMEPETLAIASCVSSTWSQCFSSEYLWKSLLVARSTCPSSPYEIAMKTMEIASYKRLVSTVEADAKRRRKNQQPEVKISLSDLTFIVHVSTGTKKASVLIKGKDLEFGSNDRFQIKVDVSNSLITSDEKEVRLTWQVVYRDWEKFFTMADITRSLEEKYGWFTDELPVKERFSSGGCKLKGDVKPSFNGEVLEKIGFAIVASNDWGSMFVNDVLRYLQRFFVE